MSILCVDDDGPAIQAALLPALLLSRLSKSPGVVLLSARAIRNMVALCPMGKLDEIVQTSLLPSLCGAGLEASPHHVQSALVAAALAAG